MSGSLNLLLILGLAGQVDSNLVSVTGVDPTVAEAARAAVIKAANEQKATRWPTAGLPIPIEQYHFRIVKPANPAVTHLQIAGACRVQDESWRTALGPVAFDGGPCYFYAFYDPATKTLVSLDFNGR